MRLLFMLHFEFLQMNSLIAIVIATLVRILQNITNWGQYYTKKSFIWCWCLGCMLFHMLSQMNRLLARVIAFLASKGFFTSVGKHVSPQIAWSSARIITLLASKGFLASVWKSVIFYSAWTSAREAALIAGIRFFSSVNPFMVNFCLVVSKRFGTKTTFVWTFASMNCRMSLEKENSR